MAPQGADEAGARNRAAVNALADQATTSVGAAIGEMLAAVLADLPGATAPQVDAITSAARTAWRAAVDRIIAWVRETFGRLLKRAEDNTPADLPDLAPDVGDQTIEQRVQALMSELAAGLDEVPDVVASRTATALREGYADGESPAELRARVADVLQKDAWEPEVERIARTTTTTVYNAAHDAANDELERQLRKPLPRMWLATQDTRTRATHREAHGQVIESGESFTVGGAHLRYPGDPLGPPDEIVQCRCLAVAVLDNTVIDLAHRVAGRDIVSAQVAVLAAALTAVSRMPPAFQVYWTRGKGAGKIRWGQPGDFNRCRRALAKYGLGPEQLSGACANLHHLALGVWPGREAAADVETAAAEEGADMPCPCETMTDEQIEAAAAQLAAPPAPPKRKRKPGDPTAPVNAPSDAPVDDGEHDEPDTEPADDLVDEEDDGNPPPDAPGVEPDHPARQRITDPADSADDPADDEDCDGEDCPPVEGTVSGDPDLPFTGRDVAWDGSAAEQAVAAWAAKGDGVDPAKYGRAFFYRDPDADPTTQAAYKLGFATVVNGELRAVPKGIFAVASVLSGGRGGVDIPAAEQQKVQSRVGAYYRRMATQFKDDTISVPWGDDSGSAATVEAAADDTPPSDASEDGRLPDSDESGDDALSDAQAGGMVALLPSTQDAERIAVDGDGAIPVDDLHLTLLFLGDDGGSWADTDAGAMLLDLAQRVATDIGPITGELWQVGATSDVAMYLVGDDSGRLAELQAGLVLVAGNQINEQRSPWVAHISTRYGSPDTTGMDAARTPVTFDRIRVSFGDQNTDFELTGDDTLELDDETGEDPMPEDQPTKPDPSVAASTGSTAVAAGAQLAVAEIDNAIALYDAGEITVTQWNALAAHAVAELRAARKTTQPEQVGPTNADLRVALAAAVAADTIVARAAENAPATPPGEWFKPVEVDGPTPPTVTAEGRVWGHIGQAGVCHVGIRDECVTIPPSRTGYGAFHKDQITTAEGDTVQVGYLYTGCDHSSIDSTMDQARDYLDTTCVRTAAGRVHDTEWGPMFVGSIVPGAGPENVGMLHKLSGEWFPAPLELHAAVGVTDAGFPVDGTGDELLTAEQAPPLAASAHQPDQLGDVNVAELLVAVEDYRRTRAGAAVVAAAKHQAVREMAAYTKRGD